MARRKQQTPNHLVQGSLGVATWAVVPAYPQPTGFTTVPDHESDLEGPAPGINRKQRSKKARSSVRTTARTDNQQTPGFAVCCVVFSSPQAYMLPPGSQLDVEIVMSTALSHQTTCLSVTATAKGAAESNVQVLLPVPSYGTAAAFVRLVHTGKLTLSVAPYEESLATDLLGRAASGSVPPLNTKALQPVLHKSYCFLAPTSEATRDLGHENDVAQPASSTAPHNLVAQLQGILPDQATRLVAHQGVDVCWPEEQPACSPGPRQSTSAGGKPSTDHQTWHASCWLSARLSALLLPEDQAGTSSSQQPAATLPGQGADTEPARVLLPGETDGLWQLIIQLAPQQARRSSSGGMRQAKLDTAQAKQDQQDDDDDVEVQVVDREGAGAEQDGDGGDDDDDDAEVEARSSQQDDVLTVLRWLLPSHARHMHGHAHHHATWQSPASHMASAGVPSSQPAAAAELLDGDLFTGGFSASKLYKAVKPAGSEPEYTGQLPGLVPVLRPYQRRAVAWMLSREQGQPVGSQQQEVEHAAGHEAQGASHSRRSGRPGRKAVASNVVAGSGGGGSGSQVLPELHPLWRQLVSLDGTTSWYLNPYSGLLRDEAPAPPAQGPASVKGGILCDEMGLGKTVELLACIMSNRFTGDAALGAGAQPDIKPAIKQHINCPCGYKHANPANDGGYDGLWVMCDQCQAWMHGVCVGVTRSSNRTFVCSGCKRQAASQQVTGPCGTTLIVCPAAILAQWWTEIHKHVSPGAVCVKVYSGQMQAGSSNSALMSSTWALPTSSKAKGGSVQLPECVSAADLASADIVLTTYDALKKDLDRQPDLDAPTKQFRRHKKYEVVPTPLTRLRWWRIVLDEAQMVESSTAKAASMALKLQAVHRWCVTGTPISRGLEDVYGLMAFLKVRPWASHMWWMRGIQRPAEEGCHAGLSRLLHLLKPALGGLMWRTAKQDVLDQLNIPVQHHHVTFLYLSPVERHFYMRQHQECAAKVRDVLPSRLLAAAAAVATSQSEVQLTSPTQSSGETEVSQLNRPLTVLEQKKLIQPLLRLRQAACHPQVGGGGIKAITGQRAPMTMEEILQVLIAKAKIEAEEAQRALIASLNGIAALILLEQGERAGMADAVAVYREAVQVMEGNKQSIDTDPLQTLHTLHNLHLLLSSGAADLPGVPRTLRDDTLQRDADAIRDKYVEQRRVLLAVRQEEFNKAVRAASPFDNHQGWFITALDMLSEVGLGGPGVDDASSEEQVVRAVKEHLQEKDTYRRQRNVNSSSIVKQFRSIRLLKEVLIKALDEIESQRQTAMDKMQELIDATARASPDFVQQAGACRCREHLAQKSGRLCEHCVLDEKMIHWEIRLFSLYSQAKNNVQVSAEEAAQRAAAHMRRQVGLGGLGESLEAQDAGGAVLEAQILWKPSEAEEVLKLVSTLFTRYCVNRSAASSSQDVPLDRAQVQQVAARAKAHLERLESQRKLFPSVRALSVAQRTLLYAHDELDMAVARTRFRQPGEYVAPLEESFKIWPEEIPIRNKDLSNDKLVAQGDLQRSLGTLRYLVTLKSTRQAALVEEPVVIEEEEEEKEGQEAVGAVGACDETGGAPRDGQAQAATDGVPGDMTGGPSQPGVNTAPGPSRLYQQQHSLAGPSSAVAAAGGAASTQQQPAGGVGVGQVVGEICPICHDPIRAQFAMLTCGHMVCCDCIGLLVDKVGSHVPKALRKVACPNCRMKVPLDDISYVETGGTTRSSTAGMAHTLHVSDQGAAVAALTAPWQAEDAARSSAGGAPDMWAGEASISVSGSYGTKIEAVVRRLLYLIASDPDTKVLVFSSWLDLLELLAHALALNKLPFALAKGGQGFQKALAAFQGKTSAASPHKQVARGKRHRATRDASSSEQDGSEQDDASGSGRGEEIGGAKVMATSTAGPSTRKRTRAGNSATVADKQPTPADNDMVDAQQTGAAAQGGASEQMQGAAGSALRRSSRRVPRKRYASDAEQDDEEEVEAQPATRTQGSSAAGQQSSEAAGGSPHQEGRQAGTKRPGGRRHKQTGRGKQPVRVVNLVSNEAPRILLLLMSQGGAGLNLTEAQHVVLLEPSTDPAAEAQAVGRIHRIGQTRETHVHRFVVRLTVEENVAALSASKAAAMDMSYASAAAAARSGKNQEGLMRVCDVALLLTTPWSHEADAPRASVAPDEELGHEQQPGTSAAPAVHPVGGATQEPGPAARAAAAAEARQRQQQQAG